MLVFLALLSCTSGSGDVTVGEIAKPPPIVAAKPWPAILVADTSPVEMPTEAMVQTDCWQAARPKPTPKPTTSTAPKAPSSGTRSASSTGYAPAMEGLVGGSGDSAGPSAPAPVVTASEVASAPPPPASTPAPDPAPAAPAKKKAGADDAVATGRSEARGAKDEDSSRAAAREQKPEAESTRAKQRKADAAEKTVAEAAMPAEEEPKLADAPASYLDWGAKIYLSNDDSMSLASAQHLLHAVKEGQAFGAGDIRPHELLNYFSFDTKAPSEGELFSVVPSAEKTEGETLTVAFAVKGATPPRRPLDLTVVLDVSGSMAAEGRMEYTRRALQLTADNLQDGDRLDLVLFDDKVCTAISSFVSGRDDVAVLKKEIDRLKPRGGTNISIGLKEGYRLVTQEGRDQGTRRNRRIMLMTDASVNQGIIDKDVLAMVGEAYEKKNVRVTGVGVGVGFRDDLLDEVTERGKGAYVYLGSEAVVDRLFGVGFRSLTETIAHEVQFELDLPDTLAMKKFYGEEASTDAADIQPIHYYTGTTQLFLQDLHVKPGSVSPKDPVTLTIRYRDAASGEPGEQRFDFTVGEILDADRHNIDKARALMAWTDLLTQQATGGGNCGAAVRTYSERAAKVQDDSEIAYVNGLVGQKCTMDLPVLAPPPTLASTGVAYKVKVDSDVPIAEVALSCGSTRLTEKLSGSDTVARFQAEPGASCRVVFQGVVAMEAPVTVPVTGGDVKCTIRGGRLSCG